MRKRKDIISVLGLGYVGLPIFLRLQVKYQCVGFDIDKSRIDQLKKKNDKNFEFKKKDLNLSRGSLFTNDYLDLKKSTIFIICVPTPINRQNNPDLEAIISATNILTKVIKKGDIIIFESTVYPSVTEDICEKYIERKTGLKSKVDFYISYSPERINPGDKKHVINKINKILSVNFNDIKIIKKIKTVYKQLSKKLIFSKFIKETEAAKLLENIQRDINIALMNEVLQICHRLNLNFQEVYRLAKTKWNFLKFYPGLVGGHCLPVDPYYLSHISKKKNYIANFILTSRKVNDQMFKYVLENIENFINKNKILKPKILIMGISYKPNIADTRNSIAFKIFKFLKKKYNKTEALDPVINKKLLNNYKIMSQIRDFKTYDLIVPLVKHQEIIYMLKKINKNKSKILDLFSFN